MLQIIRIPSLLRCGFGPLIHTNEYPFSSQNFPNDNTAGVLSKTFIANFDIHNCLFMPLHFSIGGYEGLHDFVKISISASLKSFLLIICIDAPESTTNSRSSNFRIDAGRHLFSEGEKNVALRCSINLKHIFGQLPRCFAGTLLATLSLLVNDPLILEHGGYAHEVHLGKCNRTRDFGLEFLCDVQKLRESHTLDWLRHVGALPEDRLRRRHVLKHATQLPCIRKSTFR